VSPPLFHKPHVPKENDIGSLIFNLPCNLDVRNFVFPMSCKNLINFPCIFLLLDTSESHCTDFRCGLQCLGLVRQICLWKILFAVCYLYTMNQRSIGGPLHTFFVLLRAADRGVHVLYINTQQILLPKLGSITAFWYFCLSRLDDFACHLDKLFGSGVVSHITCDVVGNYKQFCGFSIKCVFVLRSANKPAQTFSFYVPKK
jgi:hypothetical protein